MNTPFASQLAVQHITIPIIYAALAESVTPSTACIKVATKLHRSDYAMEHVWSRSQDGIRIPSEGI